MGKNIKFVYLGGQIGKPFIMISFGLKYFRSLKGKELKSEKILSALPSSNFWINGIGFNTSFCLELIDEMASEGTVDSAWDGTRGTKSIQYKRYEWLRSNVPEEFLIELTDHSSPVVRVYAFFALYDNRSAALGEICQKHINDSAIFQIKVSGLHSTRQVNECFKHMLQYAQ